MIWFSLYLYYCTSVYYCLFPLWGYYTVYLEGDLFLVYDQAHDKLGAAKFEPMWHGLYIVKRVLAKWAYELVIYDGVSLDKPQNGLYLKRYYE